jgi:hypothetical protein
LIKLSNYKFTTYVENPQLVLVAEMAFTTLLRRCSWAACMNCSSGCRVPRTVNRGDSVVIAAVVTGVFPTAQMAEITPWKVKMAGIAVYLAGVKGVME